VSHTVGLVIESIVAGLLVVTIGYCVVLNKRLMRLKADEMSLKATISELITATEIAERAVSGLKVAVGDCDRDIGERLRAAEQLSGSLAQQLNQGQDILVRLARIVTASKATPEVREVETPDPKAMLAAAQAFAERARARVTSAAA
jgi:hypothetical protein